MTVRISLPLTALENQDVAQAMSALMLALGDEVGTLVQEVVPDAAPAAPSAPQPEAAIPPAEAFTQKSNAKSVSLAESLKAYALQNGASGSEEAPAPRKRRRPRPVAKPTTFEGTPTERYEAFKAGLKDTPRAFLALLEERKTVTIKEAMEALGIEAPKKLGGITGSISRWAPNRGIRVPFLPTIVGDEKAWVWIGVEGEVPVLSPTAAPKAATPSQSESNAAQEAQFNAFIDALPDQSRKFMELLREQKQLRIKDVLDAFSLTRAVAVGGIIEPIKRLSKEHGVEQPFRADLDENQDRVWFWPSAPANTDETPAEAAESNVAPLVNEEAGEPHLPGVRRRRANAS
ncbi:MAG: hypothetical protein ACE366_21550 [Bradymonadia bacterium]